MLDFNRSIAVGDIQVWLFTITSHGRLDLKKQEINPFWGVRLTVQKWLWFLWQPIVAGILLEVLARCVPECKASTSPSRRTEAQTVTLILIQYDNNVLSTRECNYCNTCMNYEIISVSSDTLCSNKLDGLLISHPKKDSYSSCKQT